MALKLQEKLILLLFVPSLALGRGAGGGGDGEEIVNLNNGVRERLVLKSYWQMATRPYETEFCEAISSGLKKINPSKDELAKAQLVCQDSNRVVAVNQIMSDEGLPLTAKNYPQEQRIEISKDRIESLRANLSPEVFRVLLEAIGVHEIESLVGVESSTNYVVSSKLLPPELLAGFREQNNLEKAIGPLALRAQMSRKISDLYIGLTFNNMRDQLTNFSPAFDAEVEETIGVNYKLDFRSLRAERGSRYLVPWNQQLLKPVLERLREKIQEHNVELIIGSKPSWSLAIQLHQVLLSLLKTTRLQGYKIEVSSAGLLSWDSSIALDKAKKTISIYFKSKLDDHFTSLKDMYRFEIIREYTYSRPEPHTTQVLQSWPEINVGQMSSKYTVAKMGGHFVFNENQPAYQEAAMISSSGSIVGGMKKDLGLVTYTKLLDFVAK